MEGISEDFNATIVKETPLIEAFGPCLPTREDVESSVCNRAFALHSYNIKLLYHHLISRIGIAVQL